MARRSTKPMSRRSSTTSAKSTDCLRPFLRPDVQRQEEPQQLAAQGRETVAHLIVQLDQPGRPELGQARIDDGRAGADRVLQFAEAPRPVAQLPDDPQGPAAAQQIEQRHDRPAAFRAARRTSGQDGLHHLFHSVTTFSVANAESDRYINLTIWTESQPRPPSPPPTAPPPP